MVVRMTIQTPLEEFKAGFPDEQDISLSKSVRNVNYQMLDDVEISNCQRIVLEEILKHPKGINDKGIAANTGLPLSSVCARRNELMQQGLVVSIGVRVYPDYKGRMRPNTLWGIVTR
jgi:hypothetical protein